MKFLTSILLALGTIVLLGANSAEACKSDSDCTSWNAWCSKNSWTYHCDPDDGTCHCYDGSTPIADNGGR